MTCAVRARAPANPRARMPWRLFFSFSYPCEHSRQYRSQLANLPTDSVMANYVDACGGRWDDKDPFVLFLCNGGFVYFDYKYEICGIRAVSFDSSKEANKHLHVTGRSASPFFLSLSLSLSRARAPSIILVRSQTDITLLEQAGDII